MKKKLDTEVDANTNSTMPDIKLVFKGIEELHLNLNLGRQDLDETFKKVEDKINEIIKKL